MGDVWVAVERTIESCVCLIPKGRRDVQKTEVPAKESNVIYIDFKTKRRVIK